METIKGELELDKEGGVIWFNDENGMCRLRISDLTKDAINSQFLDIVPKRRPPTKEEIEERIRIAKENSKTKEE